MSFKDKLTKLGLIEEETKAVKAAPHPTAPNVSMPMPTLPRIAPDLPTAMVDQSMATMLAQSLQDNKLAGFDYQKFISAVEEMKAYGTPEEARFKMAFTTAKQLGVDKDGLVKSGQHYLDVLHQNETDFEASCKTFDKKEIQGRQAQLSDLQNQVATLTKQLADAKEAGDKLTVEIEEKQTSLESRRSSFKVTLESFTSVIENNIDKINKYL